MICTEGGKPEISTDTPTPTYTVRWRCAFGRQYDRDRQTVRPTRSVSVLRAVSGIPVLLPVFLHHLLQLRLLGKNRVYLIVKILDHDLGFEIDFIVVLCPAAILLLLPIPLIMISGARIAATQESTRFSKINGYGSNALVASTTFTTIHRSNTPANEKMNAQLPANFAIVSAARCPSVYFSFSFRG